MTTLNTGDDWRKDAPLLAALQERPRTDVPDNYFPELEERTLALARLHSVYSQSRDLPVPEGYFDELDNRILANVTEQPVRKRSVIIFRSAVITAIAAAFAVFVSVSLLLNRNPDEDAALRAVSDAEIVSYLQTSTDASDLSLAAENSAAAEPVISGDLTDDELNDYLESSL
jgi:hypothetical protein